MKYFRFTCCTSKLVFSFGERKLHLTSASIAARSEGVIHAKLFYKSQLEQGKTKEIQEFCQCPHPGVHNGSCSVYLLFVENDLTKENVDAVVNAANSWLKHGGGVAGAVVKRGGTEIQQESDKYVKQNGPVQTGDVAVTGPGTLACKLIIHAVGPVWEGGEKGEANLLHSSVWKSLCVCHTRQLSSVAMAAISSGIFGFPKDQCADILFTTSLKFLKQHPESSLNVIRFTNFDQATVAVFKETARTFAHEPNVRFEESRF